MLVKVTAQQIMELYAEISVGFLKGQQDGRWHVSESHKFYYINLSYVTMPNVTFTGIFSY